MSYRASLLLLFQAARETGALQAAKNKLEKQVEELTWRLQLEKRMRVYKLTELFELLILFYSSLEMIC